MTELSYCAEQIKDFDNDRYVAALFADEVVNYQRYEKPFLSQ